ncbi:MAG: hypothetical protein J0L83_11450 [Chitinophagales bacterium]|nr:hypothetical protein [Chitinophagales bacterium]
MNSGVYKMQYLISTVCIYILVLTSYMLSAQTEQIYLHNGTCMNVKVIRSDAYTYTVRLINKGSVEAQLSKYAIHTIRYDNGIVDTISKKVEIISEEDWQKVIMVEDKSALSGFTKAGDVFGHTAFLNLHTPTSANNKAVEKLKRAAARMAAPFVLLVFDRESTLLPVLRGLGGFQCQKSGVAYRY